MSLPTLSHTNAGSRRGAARLARSSVTPFRAPLNSDNLCGATPQSQILRPKSPRTNFGPVPGGRLEEVSTRSAPRLGQANHPRVASACVWKPASTALGATRRNKAPTFEPTPRRLPRFGRADRRLMTRRTPRLHRAPAAPRCSPPRGRNEILTNIQPRRYVMNRTSGNNPWDVRRV